MTDIEVDTTARTIWGEARGEGVTGMTAVANVICNRVSAAQEYFATFGKPHPLFGDGSFEDCCRRPWQFSCWNPNDPNRQKLVDVTIDDPQFLEAMNIARNAVEWNLPDTTNDATYYKVIGVPANWAEGKEPCCTIGNQQFYNDV